MRIANCSHLIHSRDDFELITQLTRTHTHTYTRLIYNITYVRAREFVDKKCKKKKQQSFN